MIYIYKFNTYILIGTSEVYESAWEKIFLLNSFNMKLPNMIAF